ncbi:MAG: hypothetical protein WHT08_06525 [Bryobacteraceae bacterium]
MKTIFAAFVLTAWLSGAPAAAQGDKAREKGAAGKPAAAGPKSGAPAAKKPGMRETDAEGRTWVWRETPFGLAKVEEKRAESPSAAVQSKPAPGFRVVEVRGDEVRFERRSPFTQSTWTKRMSELNEDEKRALEIWKESVK